MMHIRKNDKVKVLTGRDKGKEGVVLKVSPRDAKVLVQGIALVTRHVKPRRQGETGGIRKEEGLIAISNVMPICPACKTPCRTNVKDLEDKKARICNKCKEIF
jgi:large subunit ribosomal protein L24